MGLRFVAKPKLMLLTIKKFLKGLSSNGSTLTTGIYSSAVVFKNRLGLVYVMHLMPCTGTVYAARRLGSGSPGGDPIPLPEVEDEEEVLFLKSRYSMWSRKKASSDSM